VDVHLPAHGVDSVRDSAQANQTLASAVFAQLRDDILEWRLKPATRLRFADLRARYKVGISPLREALMRLASEGLVVLEDHRGFHVAPVSKANFLDIAFMRKELETRAFVLSIQHGDEDWQARVLTAFHALSRHPEPDQGDEWDVEWDARHHVFHAALASGCGSAWLLRFRSILYDQWDRYRRLAVRNAKTNRNYLDEHRELKDAALERDADAAAYLIHRHISASTRAIVEASPAIFDS